LISSKSLSTGIMPAEARCSTTVTTSRMSLPCRQPGLP
jgi:hypothetical protein